MSTRKGRTIKLEVVLEEAITRVKDFNPNSEIAKIVGIGAVKYNDLKRSPTSGYTFDWDEMLNLEGNSGPYLQYTHARCKSVLKRSSITDYRLQITDYSPNLEELAILRFLYRFPKIVQQASQQYAPNLVCTFLFELAQRYNTFYNQHRILPAKKQETRNKKQETEFRLLLTVATAQILKNGLKLLGIEAPEKM
jgi:arginyl-tRNA synthetase